MTPAIAHRIPRPLSVLTALAALALSAPLALIGAPGHAAPAEDDSATVTLSMDIVVKSDDTYSVKFVMSENGEYPVLQESTCTKDSFMAGSSTSNLDDLKAIFKEDGDTRTCTMEGTSKISNKVNEVTHKNGEYIVKLPDFGDGPDSVDVEVTQSVTFPGKVTEADGGEVKGNKVTFTDFEGHTVKGKDGSIPMWVWILTGVVALAVIGAAATFFILRSKKNKPQTPYGTAAQGYDPSQAFPAQPGQQAGYGAPQAQPGYGTPGEQAGYGAPQAQPGYGTPGEQAGYGAPQAQPGQQPGYGAPGQGTY